MSALGYFAAMEPTSDPAPATPAVIDYVAPAIEDQESIIGLLIKDPSNSV